MQSIAPLSKTVAVSSSVGATDVRRAANAVDHPADPEQLITR
jgi:hypothetical protein